MFSKILIANRGEIAVRIIRACKDMGISTVAVYSEADRDTLPVSLAEESICIGPPVATDSYLNMNAVLSAAIHTGAQAIHPGYGFLSESARFAELCRDCGVVFIGPSHQTVASLGDKDRARRMMAEAGLPVVPGSGLLQDAGEAERAAGEIGCPVLLKARAGGGGRGIRIAEKPGDVAAAFPAARSEAAAAFGDDALYMEKYLHPVSHIEMQILGDRFGNVVCLGDRECSVQRKNQKLLEESPSPKLCQETRERMSGQCVHAARAIGYEGLGTIEFLLDDLGNYYFMEMNTRLQVEHPVTEMVTGIDLVKWQLRVAAGIPLGFSGEDIRPTGCAMECRIVAENPQQGFRPSSGRVSLLHIPGGPWVRFDTALFQGLEVPPYYDSLVGKLIVHAMTREEAIRKMRAALCELVIEGIDHNADLQSAAISGAAFLSGSYYTDYLDKEILRVAQRALPEA